MARVRDSPVAKSVTAWPAATSPSVSSAVSDSIEPESGGGTDVATGATCAMRSGGVIAPAVSSSRGSTRPASKQSAAISAARRAWRS